MHDETGHDEHHHGHADQHDAGHHDHEHDRFERRCDVVIIGGSAAGLAAALNLARSRRSVIVVDAGDPRNAPAAHMHGYLGWEGRPPADLLDQARREVRSYGVEILHGRASEVTIEPDGRFRTEVGPYLAVNARRVIVATGIVDELPDIPGLAEHWGDRVLHCPYCHGWEVRGGTVVVVATHAASLHQAGLFRQLSDDVTVVLHDGVEETHGDLAALSAAGVRVVVDRVVSVAERPDGLLLGLADGEEIPATAVVVTPRFRARTDVLTGLGAAIDEDPAGLGVALRADPGGATSVDGVFAAGNVRTPWWQVAQAAGDGAFVGARVNHDLVEEDLGTAAFSDQEPSDHEWDELYAGDEPRWSGNPNGALVAEVADLPPGRAIDIGCGEGADAIWLAERGWQVSATDVARSAIDRGAREAAEREVAVTWSVGALGRDPIPSASFDLVSMHYPAVPKTPGGEAIEALLAAAAPGGTVLVVGHAFGEDHGHDGDHATPFDPAAYVQPDDVAARLDGDPAWTIEAHEVRERPDGHGTEHHRDVVMRARRVA